MRVTCTATENMDIQHLHTTVARATLRLLKIPSGTEYRCSEQDLIKTTAVFTLPNHGPEVNDLLTGAPLPAYLGRMPTWCHHRRWSSSEIGHNIWSLLLFCVQTQIAIGSKLPAEMVRDRAYLIHLQGSLDLCTPGDQGKVLRERPYISYGVMERKVAEWDMANGPVQHCQRVWKDGTWSL
ncbi:hypothetical protein Bbelb_069240 [Branchiostoma belcheri]|nr:hypothetical protein Bbelb_069240 [Branchiostoma belcheri]